MAISVKVSYNSAAHRFTLPHSPTFITLCESLIQHLRLPTSAAALVKPNRPPYTLWFLDDERDYCRLFDDLSLREALRLSPYLLRLRVEKSAISSADTAATMSAVTVVQTDPPVFPPQFSSASLLKVLSHIRNHGASHVRDELGMLINIIKRHEKDPPSLREVRHDLASLLSNFLAKELGPATEGRVETDASVALQKSLRDILEGANVSRATTEQAVKAVRTVSGCRAACDVLRARYTALLTESVGVKMERMNEEEREKGKQNTVRPVKHYLNQFVRLMRVAGKDAQDAYEAFAVAKREAEARGEKFQVSRRLCKGVQRACFHFLRCHVTEGKEFEIESRAVDSLAKAVPRKLRKVGYNEFVLQLVHKLVQALARDSNVLHMAYGWANKPERPMEEPKDDSKDLPEVGQESKEWGDVPAMVRQTGKRNDRRKQYYKEESSSSSRSRTSESGSDDRDQYASYSKYLRWQRRRDDEDDTDSSKSSGSLASIREEEWNQSQRYPRKGGQKANVISPMESSDERYRRNEANHANDARKSSDTQRSQWARIEMEKEEEMKQRQRGEQRRGIPWQMEREQRFDHYLAQLRDQEQERRADERKYRTYRQNCARLRNLPSALQRPILHPNRSHPSAAEVHPEFEVRESTRRPDDLTSDALDALEYRLGSERRTRSLASRVVGSISGRGSRFGNGFDQRRGPPVPHGWRDSPMPQDWRNQPMQQRLRDPPMPSRWRDPRGFEIRDDQGYTAV